MTRRSADIVLRQTRMCRTASSSFRALQPRVMPDARLTCILSRLGTRVTDIPSFRNCTVCRLQHYSLAAAVVRIVPWSFRCPLSNPYMCSRETYIATRWTSSSNQRHRTRTGLGVGLGRGRRWMDPRCWMVPGKGTAPGMFCACPPNSLPWYVVS